MTNKDLMKELYETYNLSKDDIFKHKHYTIITRAGIEKIQAQAHIDINYDVVWCGRDYCIVKATGTLEGKTITTLASAVQWGKEKREIYGREKRVDLWSTDSRYIAEIAEKRAMSRIVLKLLGLYAEWCFGEDEDVDNNEKTEEEKPFWIDEIDAIETVDWLKEYHKKHEWQGKEMIAYLSRRKAEIQWKSTT